MLSAPSHLLVPPPLPPSVRVAGQKPRGASGGGRAFPRPREELCGMLLRRWCAGEPWRLGSVACGGYGSGGAQRKRDLWVGGGGREHQHDGRCCKPQLSCSMCSSRQRMPSMVRRAAVLQAVAVVVGRQLQRLWCCSAASRALRVRSGPCQAWCDLAVMAVWQSSPALVGGLF
jgi:hypothetical protein